jgi:hypothetical protein
MGDKLSKKYGLKNGHRGSTEGSSAPKLFAYCISHSPPMRLPMRLGYGALPSRLDGGHLQPIRQPLSALEEISNQAEWFVLNSHPLRVTCNGGN